MDLRPTLFTCLLHFLFPCCSWWRVKICMSHCKQQSLLIHLKAPSGGSERSHPSPGPQMSLWAAAAAAVVVQIICCRGSSRPGGISQWERCVSAGGGLGDMSSVQRSCASAVRWDEVEGATWRCITVTNNMLCVCVCVWPVTRFLFPHTLPAASQSDMAAERVVKTEEGQRLAKVICHTTAPCDDAQCVQLEASLHFLH